MARRLGTRPLVEGALLAAIAVIIVLLGAYVPVVGPFMVFLWPVPVVIIQLRHGLRVSLLVLAVAGLALGGFIGVLSAVTLVLSLGAVGVALGEGVRRNWPATLNLAVGTAVVAVSLLLTVGISLWVFHIDPIKLQFDALQKSLDISATIWDKLGAGQSMQPARQVMEQAIAASRYVLPAILLMASAINALVNYLVAGAVLARLGHRPRPLPPFAEWRMPVWVIFVYAAALAMVFGGQRLALGWLGATGDNIMTPFNLAFVIEGLAVVYSYLARWSMPKWFRILLLVYLPFIPVVGQFVLWGGMLDVAIDLRRLGRRSEAT